MEQERNHAGELTEDSEEEERQRLYRGSYLSTFTIPF